MAILHIVVLAATLTVLLFLPGIVAAIVHTDPSPGRTQWTRGRRRETRALRRLDRRLDNNKPAPAPSAGAGPGIEQLAADLRRLNGQRYEGLATGSASWQAAIVRAYDDRLDLAGRRLGVDHHLCLLTGTDRDIERLRVEEKLQAAGLQVRATRPPHS